MQELFDAMVIEYIQIFELFLLFLVGWWGGVVGKVGCYLDGKRYKIYI